MPDFLSRLIERTFGLIPVAQPVLDSIFTPMHAVKSDYIQGLDSGNDSPGNTGVNQNDGAPVTTPQQAPALNRKKPINKDDTKPSHTSVSRPQHNIEPLNQNESDFPEQVESVPLQQMSEQDNRYPHTPPAKLAQDEEPLYQIDSDTLESVKSEPSDVKNRNNRSTLPPIPKPKLYEEQFREAEPDSQGHVEPEQKDFADIRENRNTFMPVLKPIYDKEPPQSLETSSLERAGSMPSHPVSVQKNRNINRSVFTREPELPYENLSASKHLGSKNPGESWQNEPLIDNVDSSVDNTLLGHISDSSLQHESLSSPIIGGRQNPKRVNNPKVNATLEHMDNMLIDQHAVAPRPPSTVPTVKVTICRIEVRAVTPPPQPQTPPPKQHPALSLDDYLKQYNG